MDAVEKRSLKLGLGAWLSAFGVALTWFCCLPLALGSVGLGAAALGAAMLPLRPWLSAAALLLLGGALYSRYRKPSCASDARCAVTSSRMQQLALWMIAAATLALLTVDRWASWIIYWLL